MNKYRIRAYCTNYMQAFKIQRKAWDGWRTIRDQIYSAEDAMKKLNEIRECEGL